MQNVFGWTRFFGIVFCFCLVGAGPTAFGSVYRSCTDYLSLHELELHPLLVSDIPAVEAFLPPKRTPSSNWQKVVEESSAKGLTPGLVLKDQDGKVSAVAVWRVFGASSVDLLEFSLKSHLKTQMVDRWFLDRIHEKVGVEKRIRRVIPDLDQKGALFLTAAGFEDHELDKSVDSASLLQLRVFLLPPRNFGGHPEATSNEMRQEAKQ